MHFVGVDLAWGEKKPTGLAVLDTGGHLIHLSAQQTDGDIEAALAPYIAGEALVAIDAPLVVANATSNRPAEAALNRDFARFDAGAHPSNTGNPQFAGTPRGARVATMLGLDMDPSSRSARRAIEVYPHPATVAIFRLGRTLKYKNKTGRPLPELRDELLRLMGLLEGLAGSPVPLHLADTEDWAGMRARVESAKRKIELRRAEDQVDAVVCAYVAIFAERRPDLTTTYGDFRSGYIVTPTLPKGHLPSPRVPGTPAPIDEPPVVATDPVRKAIQTYAGMHPQLRDTTDRFVARVSTLLDDAGINYLSVTGRAKSVASFAAKAHRAVDGKRVFADPLDDITDQIGVRVIAYLRSDVEAVADLLSDQFTVLDDRDMGQETASEGRFGYASRHLLVAIDAAQGASVHGGSVHGPSAPARPSAPGPSAAPPPVGVRPAQVQVRTVLQHAWAEFEHAIRYKGTIPEEHGPDLDRRFTLAAGLLELADREFSMIQDRLQATVSDRRPEPDADADADDPRISPQDLATFLAGRFNDAGWSRTDHYAWICDLLLELGITSLEELAGLLSSIDNEAINARMSYRYPAGAVRRLDDALLAVFGARYLGLHGNAHREAMLRTRLEKVRMPVAQPDP